MEKGMGERKNKSDHLNNEEEVKQWQLKGIGRNNPTSLNYSVYCFLS